jgi:flagellar motor switch protein FliM
LFLTALRSACEDIVSIEPSIERVESDPKLIELASGNEPVVLCSFELAIGEARGTLDLAMPESAASLLRAEPPRRASHSELVVVLAETSITGEQLADLAIGDIITTDTPIDAPLTIRIDGAAALKVRPGARAGRKAVRIMGATNV